MDVSYDPAKNGRNIRERGLPFDRAADFDFSTAVIEIDRRRDYGETRIVA
ncbi:MAG TPA: BrnT family toxin [Stellaceae bacterium]|nr:BrnT family toxin [Stellaceae bacterium]